MRVSRHSGLEPASTQLSNRAAESVRARTSGEAAATTRTVGEQVSQSLFSRPQPRLLDASEFPELAAMLVILNSYRRKLAQLVGDRDEDYALALAQDTIAAIDANGIIFLGVAFLQAHKHRIEVVVGALAHEIGHRPQRMRQLQLQVPRDLSPPELSALLLHEEIRADSFAGRGLAELGMPCEPLIEFLRAVSILPHPAYLPIEQRAQVIRDGHAGRAFRAESRRKLFPEFDRHTAARHHLGEY